MRHNRHMVDETIPADIERELAREPMVTEAELEYFEPLKEDFFALLDRAARLRSRSSVMAMAVDAAISVAGELLRTGVGIIRREFGDLSALSPRLQPAFVTRGGTRGGTGRRSSSPPASGPLARIEKQAGDRRIQLTTYRKKGQIEVEVDVVNGDSGTSWRPFDVQVDDERGQVVSARQTRGPDTDPPRFENPRSGLYVFTVGLPDGDYVLTIAVED